MRRAAMSRYSCKQCVPSWHLVSDRLPRRFALSAGTLGCAVIIGCASTTATQDVARVAIFYGRVLTPGGAPVVGARVTVQHHAQYCGSGKGEVESTLTNNLGFYRANLTLLSSDDGCVRVVATAPGFAPDSATVSSVRFVPPPASDSTETTLVIRSLEASKITRPRNAHVAAGETYGDVPYRRVRWRRGSRYGRWSRSD
jgi:hypothetical protein